ncbi:uncharacterized protein LOC129588815 [Paramacrobiotus metropolitanus]|uniref:uncharacterized protein LOC129588815 n=1 Tax=Paramacrobiotus metropolitanus TaxID=2943436 RepID=UPI002445C71E|nr:uncharacterized protein LOC129588815 [Paramacrobiotus metropolitanus]
MICLLLLCLIAALPQCAPDKTVATVLGENCNELATHCKPLFPDVKPGVWPMGDADGSPTQPAAQDYCRAAKDTAGCMAKFENTCLGDTTMKAYRNEGSFYESQMWAAEAKLCEKSVSPIRYYRAIQHCEKQRPGFEKDLLVDRSVYTHDSPNPAAGKRNVCETLKTTATKLTGASKAELTMKCGADAVDVMKLAAQKMYLAVCLNN